MEQAQPLHSADKMGKRTCFFRVRGLRNSDPGNLGFRPAPEWSRGFIHIGQGCRSWGGRGAWDRAGARLSCRDDGLSHLLTALLRTQPLRGHFTAPQAFVDLATRSRTAGGSCLDGGTDEEGEETTKGVRTAIGDENWKRLKETARSPPPFPPASMN